MKKTIGPYEIIQELGKGGMGTVYQAQHTETGQEVALKVLPPALSRESHFVLRFRREINTLKQLEHPNIAGILDTGHDGELHYYAMEYIMGSNLEETIASQGRYEDIYEAIGIMRKVARALEFAHSKGIVHRDIKPANILLDLSGDVKLTDFGIAKALEATRMTATGSIVGTAEYMAPEQAEGHTIDRRTDVYSLGIVFYRMVTGRLPFTGATSMEIMKQHRFNIPETPKALNPGITNNLSELIVRMLAKKPEDRFESMDALVRRLDLVEKQMRTADEARRSAALGDRAAAKAQKVESREEGAPVLWVKIAAYSVVLVLVLLAVYGWYAKQSRGETPQAVFDRAEALTASRDYEEAIALLSGLLEAPDAPEELKRAAEERLRTCEGKLRERELREDARLTERAREKVTAGAEALAAAGAYYQGLALLEAGKVQEARRVFDAIALLFPETSWRNKAQERIKMIDLGVHDAPESLPASP